MVDTGCHYYEHPVFQWYIFLPEAGLSPRDRVKGYLVVPSSLVTLKMLVLPASFSITSLMINFAVN